LRYRHRNRVCDAVFAAFERLFRLDRHDPELAAMLPQPLSPSALPSRGASWLAWSGMVGFAGLSQISLKYAGLDTGAFDFSAHAFALALGSAWLWVSLPPHRRIPGLDRDPAQVAVVGRFPDTRHPLCRNDPRRMLFGEPIGWVKPSAAR
jgi:hypothetical protein